MLNVINERRLSFYQSSIIEATVKFVFIVTFLLVVYVRKNSFTFSR